MRVFYLDPGLLYPEGHHPVHCRLIAGEFAARGFETTVFSHAQIDAQLKAELRAQPHFRHFTYAQSDGDPLCGWLSGFDTFVRTTLEDLMRIDQIAPTDLVYLSGTFPVELAATTAWMAQHPVEAMPFVVADFCLPPGLRLKRTAAGLEAAMPDPREDARPLLFRFAAKRMAPHILPRLQFVTFLPEASELYGRLLGRRVDIVPPPYEACTGCRNRAGTRPVVVAVLGQQQPNKGYHMVPEIVRLLLAQRPELRFLIHNATPDAVGVSDPAKLIAAQRSLREMAALDDRVTVCEGPAGKDLWSSLLERSDLVLCPYLPEYYIAGVSGVARDAVANAMPIVGPAGTGIHELIREFGGIGTVFERPEPDAIAAATLELVNDFDRYAALAHAAAMIWPTRYGARPLVDAVLALVTRR
jgi:glycosyltransferase involved in cell wall biosynthesis